MYSFAHSVMNNNLSKLTKKDVENNYIYIYKCGRVTDAVQGDD